MTIVLFIFIWFVILRSHIRKNKSIYKLSLKKWESTHNNNSPGLLFCGLSILNKYKHLCVYSKQIEQYFGIKAFFSFFFFVAFNSFFPKESRIIKNHK